METGGTGTYANTNPILEPPDQGLCTGAGYVMETVNDSLRVYTTAGVAKTTNSVPLKPKAQAELKCLRVVSVGALIAEAVRRIHNEESVSSLFN